MLPTPQACPINTRLKSTPSDSKISSVSRPKGDSSLLWQRIGAPVALCARAAALRAFSSCFVGGIDRPARYPAGGGLDYSGFDPGVVDAFGQFTDIDLGDVVHADHPEVRGKAERLVVNAGRDDHANAGFLRRLGRVFWVAAEFHRTRIDETRHAQGFDLLQPLDHIGKLTLAIEAAVVEFPAGHAGGEMLVNQGEAKLTRFAFSQDRIDGHRLIHPRLVVSLS